MNDNFHIGQRIKEVAPKGMPKIKLAKLLGYGGYSSLDHLLKGHDAHTEKIREVCNVAGISLKQFFSTAENVTIQDSNLVTGNSNKVGNISHGVPLTILEDKEKTIELLRAQVSQQQDMIQMLMKRE